MTSRTDESQWSSGTVVPTDSSHSQLEQVNALIKSKGMEKDFRQLPPPESYTFSSTDDFGGVYTSNFQTSNPMLFLGQNTERQTWAVIKAPADESGMLPQIRMMCINILANGDMVEVKSFGEMALMPPFRGLQPKSATLRNDQRRYLRIFIQYVYLRTGKLDEVFLNSLPTAVNTLCTAVAYMKTYYNRRGDVSELSRGMYAPDDLDSKGSASSDNVSLFDVESDPMYTSQQSNRSVKTSMDKPHGGVDRLLAEPRRPPSSMPETPMPKADSVNKINHPMEVVPDSATYHELVKQKMLITREVEQLHRELEKRNTLSMSIDKALCFLIGDLDNEKIDKHSGPDMSVRDEEVIVDEDASKDDDEGEDEDGDEDENEDSEEDLSDESVMSSDDES